MGERRLRRLDDTERGQEPNGFTERREIRRSAL